jgi:hypothetical protein
VGTKYWISLDKDVIFDYPTARHLKYDSDR